MRIWITTLLNAVTMYDAYDKNVDKVIKAGKELQNISNNSNRGVSDAFYFSMTGRNDAASWKNDLQSERNTSDCTA